MFNYYFITTMDEETLNKYRTFYTEYDDCVRKIWDDEHPSKHSCSGDSKKEQFLFHEKLVRATDNCKTVHNKINDKCSELKILVNDSSEDIAIEFKNLHLKYIGLLATSSFLIKEYDSSLEKFIYTVYNPYMTTNTVNELSDKFTRSCYDEIHCKYSNILCTLEHADFISFGTRKLVAMDEHDIGSLSSSKHEEYFNMFNTASIITIPMHDKIKTNRKEILEHVQTLIPFVRNHNFADDFWAKSVFKKLIESFMELLEHIDKDLMKWCMIHRILCQNRELVKSLMQS
jgi:hypothetical protein